MTPRLFRSAIGARAEGWVPDVRSISLRAGRTTVADVVLQQDGC
ncbi:hypothetical protein JOD67_000340 [Tenggerimyces flavus]|nr:hypothetical protein [Tenggerimyces flavus]